ncbi:aromatase [Kitasatospora sp. MAA4]|uniref:aromatase/cyclase n=1 Tax=Kitasatospora sp. MAA4 TaxID=3035093 RepID=UPI00247425B7|nr:aromatase/cyclase [Kitasatospora sp. MAA4]MDH6132416.1 aromatase [Kitasatospora sp. MAA4]
MAAEPVVHRTEHSIVVEADPRTLYGLIADVGGWSYTFPPNVHVERVGGDAEQERLRLWAFANGEVRSWTSRRVLDGTALRVAFQQEVSSPPVASMRGEWLVEALGDGRTRVVLLHDFTVLDDAPEAADWVNRAVDGNSRAELGALKEAAELRAERPGTLLSFEDSVDIEAPAQEVYDFLHRADLWPQRLPHVSRLDLTEEQPNVQTVRMDTRATDGTVHTTESVRVCFPPDRIVYKQVKVPELMAAHTGRWTLVPTAHGVRATSRHTVVLRPERVRDLLGPQATLDTARDLVRRSLGANSTATLLLAKKLTEAARSTG